MASDGGTELSPRILCVADEHPWPERSGYRIRLANVLRGLARVATVDLLVLHHDASSELRIPPGEPVRRILGARLDGAERTRAGIVPWLRSDLPRRIAWRDWSDARAALTTALADGYDLVWWSHLDTWVALGTEVPVPGVVDLDNLEDRWLEGRRGLRRGGGVRDRARAFAAGRLDAIDASRWRRWQRRAATDAAAAVVCTDADRVDVGGPRVRVVPNGYSAPGAPVGHPERPVPADGGVIVFVGLQTYEPNIDASRFLTQQVLPHLRLDRPAVEIHIVGRAGPEVEALDAPGVRVLGEVADLDAALAAADIVAVPIRFGAGTRIKVLEAMAQHIPIVTTAMGCEGIGLRAGVEAEIADDATTFAAACSRLLGDAARRSDLVGAAARLHAARFEWSTIADTVGEVARDAMEVAA